MSLEDLELNFVVDEEENFVKWCKNQIRDLRLKLEEQKDKKHRLEVAVKFEERGIKQTSLVLKRLERVVGIGSDDEV